MLNLAYLVLMALNGYAITVIPDFAERQPGFYQDDRGLWSCAAPFTQVFQNRNTTVTVCDVSTEGNPNVLVLVK